MSIKPQIDGRYLLMQVDDFGKVITQHRGDPEPVMVMSATLKHIERGVGIYFDLGDPNLRLFRPTEDKDIISNQGRRYVLLTTVDFK